VGVTRTYYQGAGGSSFTLGPLNLTFHPRELVFIVGGNGSGKSAALTGLYSPEAGRFGGTQLDYGLRSGMVSPTSQPSSPISTYLSSLQA